MRVLRMKMGKTQREVADSLGVSVGYYVKLELRQRAITPKLIDQCAALYGVDPGWLRDGDRIPQPPSAVAEEKRPGPDRSGNVPDKWVDQLIEELRGRKAMLESAVKEYNLTIRQALEPAINALEQKNSRR